MDVTFNNILEGARQYFQGLPAGTTGSTASPAAYGTPQDAHHRTEPDHSNELPPSSSGYWPPPQQEPPRPPTRDRPPSHHSDTSRPPSHSQYMPVTPEPNNVRPGYQQYQQQEQFQFSRPQSREAPSNFQQQAYNSATYHQPQQPVAQPVSSQSYHQSYSQSQSQPRSYYPLQNQVKPVSAPSAVTSQPSTTTSMTYKPPVSSQSYPSNSQQQSSYYKHIYSSQVQPHPQQQQHQQQHAYMVNSRPSNSSSVQESPQNEQQNMEQNFRATHNLPPIAALSVNYHHSNRLSREPSRTNNSARQRTLPSSSTSSTVPPPISSSTSSIIQQNPTRPSYSTDNYQNYRTTSYNTSQASHLNQNQYQYTTSTTQSYNHVVTTANTSGTYTITPNSQSQSSTSNQYYQTNKSNSIHVNRIQSVSDHHQALPSQQAADVQNMNGRVPPPTSVIKQKRESPLDLSVKTVRTSADSTLDVTENDARNKLYATAHHRIPSSSSSSISTHNYPTYDVPSFQRNLTQRSAQLHPATVPKVEFHPNFNVSTMNHLQQPHHRGTIGEAPRNTFQCLPEKAHNNQSNANNRSKNFMYEKPNVAPYQSTSTSRYPTVSIPSAAHVNSYIQSQSMPSPNKKSPGAIVAPRPDFPGKLNKTPPTSLYQQQLPHDNARKRSGDILHPHHPQVIPNKVPKVDAWRQSIDEQIDQRLNNYKQQQQQKYVQGPATSKTTVPNGNYPLMPQQHQSPDKKSMYGGYQKSPYENMVQHPGYNTPSSAHYTAQQSNHLQTYVPSPATHPYPGYGGYVPQTPQNPAYLHHPRGNSNPSLPNQKNNLGGAADKRVLSLLRNSLEVKGQKKLEQLKTNEHHHLHPRSDVQHPSTDVTAPLQPKAGFVSRNNVSPFTPTSFPESNTMYKFPRAVDSINYDLDGKNHPSVMDKHLHENHTVITNHHTNSAASDLDGLAAFLAARIRTKGELKQGGTTNSNSSSNNSNNNTTSLQGIIENQLKSPMKLDSNYSSTSSSKSVSPPKLPKERALAAAAAFAPRRRLFSRTEEDPSSNHVNNKVPPRDKSGLRSSSETSVFDFPDSDSENEMPVLERQSLEAMRRDRKSSVKVTEVKVEPLRPPSPGDDIFGQLCDNFVQQLKSGAGKKRAKRKKIVEPEVIAKLESVTKEKLAEDSVISDVKIKQEVEYAEVVIKEKQSKDTPSSNVSTPIPSDSVESKNTSLMSASTGDKTDVSVKINPEKKERVRRRILSTSESSESELESAKVKVKVETKEVIENESSKPSNEILPIVRPAKKPSFGDGSDFYPGWEEGVYKYKKSLRMPPTLIQVTRPPHRHSKSLPDLDTDPNSPTLSLIADNNTTELCLKSKSYKKFKSELMDSDTESNCSFNLFSKQNNNYDSEGSSSITSLPNSASKDSILDKLLQKYGGRKRRKYRKKDDGIPKTIPKCENPLELLATPNLEIEQEQTSKELKKLSTSPVRKPESTVLNFRKKTMDIFRDAFKTSRIVNEQFATVVYNSRTRKETKVLKERATIKEVFGADRPASAPPVPYIKEEIIEKEEETPCTAVVKTEVVEEVPEEPPVVLEGASPKQMLKNKLLSKGSKKNNLLKSLIDKKIKSEQEPSEDVPIAEEAIKRDPDTLSIADETEEGSVSGKKRSKLRNIRRKFSSGFDYIRKKKKAVKKDTSESVTAVKVNRRRGAVSKTNPESVQDIQKEIKTWVLNKGIGETHLHRAARLGYTDITAYCLEKMACPPSPKDNAGYTPLHEACSRGHLDIAKLLLRFGANASESAQGGIRPLHEAIENGYVEIVRLLLAYGADPYLATYSGVTPLSLATDDTTLQLLKGHLEDLDGVPGPPWDFHGPATCFDPLDLGFNILDDVPDADPIPKDEDMDFEMSDQILPVLYTLPNESPNDRWVLLQDLSNLLKVKSRDALLKQLCPPETVNYKKILREFKMTDFMEQSRCCQLFNTGEKLNPRASRVALVKYTDKVKELLNVEDVLITADR